MTEMHIRFGAAPTTGRSHNELAGQTENGVSCYRARLNTDGDILTLIVRDEAMAMEAIHLWSTRGDIHRITGTPCGTGGDGEPLLTDTTSTPLDGIEDVQYDIQDDAQ